LHVHVLRDHVGADEVDFRAQITFSRSHHKRCPGDVVHVVCGKSLDFSRQKDTLTAYLAWWLENEVKPNRAGKTYQEYELTVRLYIVPFIGGEKLDRLNPMDMCQWMASMTSAKFSNNMRRRALKVIRSALNRAIKLRIIDHNPSVAVDMPKIKKREVCPLETYQCESLFEACWSHRLGDVMVLAAMTGLRKGEILALEWSAVNIAEGVLVVRKTLEEIAGSFDCRMDSHRVGR